MLYGKYLKYPAKRRRLQLNHLITNMFHSKQYLTDITFVVEIHSLLCVNFPNREINFLWFSQLWIFFMLNNATRNNIE